MSSNADIIVIGGGIAGISAAAALATEATVTVVEAEPHLAYHSTGRSAAIFILNYGNATLRALNAAAYPALSGGLTGESVLSLRGELLVAREENMSELDAYVDGSDGVEMLTADEAVEIVPVLRRDQIGGAMIERAAQDIDVDRLLQINAQLLRARGGRILTGASVTSITSDGAGWRVQAGEHDLRAGIIVNAAGAWADQVADLAGVARIGLQPMRRSAVIMPVPEAHTGYRSWPLFGCISESWYAKPESAGLMISPADEDPVEPHDAWPDDMVLAEGLYRFEQMVDFPVVRPKHTWAGLRNFVADRTPVCGFDPDAKRFFWLAGQGGYGVQTSPALAGLTRDLVLGKAPELDAAVVAALDPQRLHQPS